MTLGEGESEVLVDAHDLAGRAHFGAEEAVDRHAIGPPEAVEREDCFLDRHGGMGGQSPPVPDQREQPFLAQFLDRCAEHDAGGCLGQRHTRRLGHEGHGARSTRVRLEDVENVLRQSELDVHQPSHADASGQRQSALADPLDLSVTEGGGGQRAGAVAGVDPGLLDVLHDATEIHVDPVVEDVDVDLHRIVEESIDEDRVLRARRRRPLHVGAQGLVVVDDLHPASAEDIGGPDQDRIADPLGDGEGLVDRVCRAVLGRGEAGLAEDPPEGPAVLGEVDGLRTRADDRHPLGLQGLGEPERGLAAELDDDASDRARSLLGGVDLEDVLEGERLEVEPAARVVVGRDGLGVAVDHNGVVARLAQREARMDTGVVELDTLADPVGAGAEDEHRGVLAGRDLALLVVAAVVVGRRGVELGRARVDRLEDRPHSECVTDAADDALRHTPQLGELGVTEAMPLGQPKQLGGQLIRRGHRFGDLVDQLDLVEEPRVDPGRVVDLLDGQPPAQCLLDEDDAPVGGSLGLQEECLRGRRFGALAVPVEGRPLLLDRAQRLLEGLGEVASDGHRLPDRLHRGGEGVVGERELLKGESRHLDDDVVDGRLETRRRLFGDVVGDLVEGEPDGHLRGDLGDREAGRLRRQRRRARDAGVHLDDDDPPILGIDGELDVAAPRVDPHFADDRDRDVTEPLVFTVGERECGRNRDRVTGVHTHRVEVLDRADDHHVVRVVAHELQLVFLPPQDRLLEQDLRRG